VSNSLKSSHKRYSSVNLKNLPNYSHHRAPSDHHTTAPQKSKIVELQFNQSTNGISFQLPILLNIHSIFDEFIVDMKEQPYVQALESAVSKLFSSTSYFWLNNSNQLQSGTLNKSTLYRSSIVSASFLKKQIIIENSPQHNPLYNSSVDPSNQFILCFPLTNSKKSIIGIMQCIRNNPFEKSNEILAEKFSEKFSKIAHLILPEHNISKIIENISLYNGKSKSQIDFIIETIKQLLRCTDLDIWLLVHSESSFFHYDASLVQFILVVEDKYEKIIKTMRSHTFLLSNIGNLVFESEFRSKSLLCLLYLIQSNSYAITVRRKL
jgi:hypothetical protein